MSVQIIEQLLSGVSLSLEARADLETAMLRDVRRARAFDITPDNRHDALQARLALLQSVYPDLTQFCQTHLHQQTPPVDALWHLWLPLALWLATRRQHQHRPFIQGILGGQGTGKTTLGAILKLLLHHLGYTTLSFSLDDLYKTYAARLQLQARDPRLIWRGPPGTHDVELGIEILDRLHTPTPGIPIPIPRFDKSLHQGAGDRTAPETVSDIDIVLFEGWFVGVRPIAPHLLETAPPPITTDADRAFARDMNQQLHHYLPLWERLDSLMVLYPVDYRLSKAWRKQAEQNMRAAGKSGMGDAEIDTFVDYFWKALHPELFIQPLVSNPGWSDLVIEIGANHMPGAVYRP